jgi:hypothetical protein
MQVQDGKVLIDERQYSQKMSRVRGSRDPAAD